MQTIIIGMQIPDQMPLFALYLVILAENVAVGAAVSLLFALIGAFLLYWNFYIPMPKNFCENFSLIRCDALWQFPTLAAPYDQTISKANSKTASS